MLGVFLVEHVDRFLAVDRLDGLVALLVQQRAQNQPIGFFVVDDQGLAEDRRCLMWNQYPVRAAVDIVITGKRGNS